MIRALAGEDKMLFAASNGGLYRSADRGHQWDLVLAEGDVSVTSVVIDRADPSVVFALGYSFTAKPLFKSTDAGKSWRAITAGLTFPFEGSWQAYSIRSLVIDQSDSKVIYAATTREETMVGWAVIVRSLDQGETWQRVSSLYTGCVLDLEMDREHHGTFYAVTGPCGSHDRNRLLKSTDGGTTWTEIGAGLPQVPFWPPWPSDYPPLLLKSVLVDFRQSSTVYVATVKDGFYRSRDGGATWAPANEGLPRFETGWSTYPSLDALTQDQDGALYAGLNPDGLYKSTDGGDHWLPLNFGSKVTGLSAGARDLLYVIGPRGIYRSTDGGDSWSGASQGIIGSRIVSLAIDSTMPGAVYAGTDMDWGEGSQDGKAGDGRWTPADPPAPGAFRSADRGRTWSRTSLPTGGWYSFFAIDSRTGTIYSTNFGTVFKSVDHGMTWQELDVPFGGIWALAIDSDRSIVYAGSTYGGVHKSVDGGRSWMAVNNGLTAGEVSRLEIDPNDTNVLFATTFNQGVFKTSDGGGSWTKLRQGLTYRYPCAGCPTPVWDWDFSIRRIAIDPSSPQVIYAGADPVEDPNNGAVLVEGGVYKSEDGGLTWRWAGAGLQSRASRTILDLAVDPRNHQVYASTYAGIYRSEGPEMSWLRVWDQPALSLALDPRPPGAIYAGTWAGVFTMSPLPASTPAATKHPAKE